MKTLFASCKSNEIIFHFRSDYNKLTYGTGTNVPNGGPMDQLLRAIAPNCSQLILQCTVGNTTMNGFDCCAKIFDPVPYFTAQGIFLVTL